MKSSHRFPTPGMGGLRLLIAALAILATLPAVAATPARAAGTATITIKSVEADGTTPLPFARFQVTGSDGTDYGKLESVPGSGQAVFTVNTGDNVTYTVTEETPPACGVAEAPKTVDKLNDGDNKTVTFKTTFDPNCTLGSLSVYSYACPANIDGSSTNYADYQAACTSTLDGETFNVAAASGSSGPWSIVTGAWGISGRAPLIGLAAGTYDVSDSANANPIVFCAKYALDPSKQTIVPQAHPAQPVKGVVGLSIDADRISCDFFTLAASNGNGNGADNGNSSGNSSGNGANSGNSSGNSSGNGNGGGNVSPAAGTASIEVHLSACPAGYTGQDFYNDCHGNGLAGHTISIAGPNGFSDSAQTTTPNTPGPGVAKFTGLVAGKYFVAEDIPGDTDTYYVYCSKAENEDQVPFTYNDKQGEGFDITLTQGLHVVCDFSIVPNLQFTPATLTVIKYACPAAYNTAGKTYNDFKADCADTVNGVNFSLSVQGGGKPTTATSGDAGAGKVVFDKLSPATYSLTEDARAGYQTPRVYCSINDGGWANKTLDGNQAASFTIDGSGQNIVCRWFNIPVQPPAANGSLTINKWQCPPGLTSGYYDNCFGDAVSGVTFNIAGPSSYSDSGNTNGKGKVVFDKLAAGSYTVTEIPPDSPHTAVYVVVCTQNGNAFNKSYDDSTGLRINFKLPAGANVVCDWYNVPPAPAPKGSITIVKELCQGKQNNAYNWSKDCVSYGAGAGFALTSQGGGSWSGATDANGKLVFSGLADGTYSLNETTGSWCHAEADNVDASGNLLVANAKNTTVYIYNCTKKSVTVLPSTGVNPAMTAGATSGTLMEVFGVAGLAFLVMLRKRLSTKPARFTNR